MTLTHEDVAGLRFPFEAHQHSWFDGRPFIDEFYICDRIEQIDPAWSFTIESVQHRMIAGTRDGLQVTAIGHLTIKGVSRSGVGMSTTLETKERKNKNSGEIYTEEANKAEKNAATDALKRAARLFGIGRYLLKWKGNVSTPDQLAAMIDKATRNGNGNH